MSFLQEQYSFSVPFSKNELVDSSSCVCSAHCLQGDIGPQGDVGVAGRKGIPGEQVCARAQRGTHHISCLHICVHCALCILMSVTCDLHSDECDL